jgi:hypothetical protein
MPRRMIAQSLELVKAVSGCGTGELMGGWWCLICQLRGCDGIRSEGQFKAEGIHRSYIRFDWDSDQREHGKYRGNINCRKTSQLRS